MRTIIHRTEPQYDSTTYLKYKVSCGDVYSYSQHNRNVKKLNERIVEKLSTYDGVVVNSTKLSIPYTINFSLKNIKSETFIHAMDSHDVYISTKSACSSSKSMSDAVYAVTKNRDYATNSLRISLSYLTKEEEIEEFLRIFDICYNDLNFRN